MRDFLPDDVRRREFVIATIVDVYRAHGFEPLETPAVENIETLLGKYGEEGDRLIFKILKRGAHGPPGQADLALRYDLTVPLARVVAEYRGRLPRYFKRYQIQPVWRADRPQRGRFREFYQCDVDVVGTASPLVEAELCGAASEALSGLGFGDFTIRLNHRRLLSGLLESCAVPAALHGEALVSLDKLDKIGRDGVSRELDARGVGEASRARLLDIFEQFPLGEPFPVVRPAEVRAAPEFAGTIRDLGIDAVLDVDPASGERLWMLAHHAQGHALALDAIRELAGIVRLTSATRAAGRVRIDPSLARGLSYYTGAIMEIAVPDLAGSLGGGGRYDNLVGMFLGQDVPAAGFSLGLERIIVVMGERGMFPPSLEGGSVDVMVTLWNEGASEDALALARDLRTAGLRADVFPDPEKLGKQIKYASARGVRFVVMAGEDERAQGTVAVKDLRSGEQVAVPRAGAAEHIRARR
jgi:histidyl-tRNA synthetase